MEQKSVLKKEDMEVIYKCIMCVFLVVCTEGKIEEIYKGCGINKGCYGIPSNCTANSNCSVVMTYNGVEEQVYKMELAGKGGEDDYVAMGLSLKSAMGNGTVMACTNSEKKKGVSSYWNTEDHNSLPQSQLTAISNITSSSEDGFLICSFYLNSTFNIQVVNPLGMDNRVNEEGFPIRNIPAKKTFTVDYNLNVKSYYLMLASGKLKTDKLTIDYHTGGRDVAKNATAMGVFNSHIKKSTLSSTTKTTTAPPTTTTSPNANIEEIYKGCGVTKGCYGFPSNCTANSNCSVVMTYSGVEEQVYKMELAGKGGDTNYVAMGLSLKSAMGNGTVMACTDSVLGLGLQYYWNTEDHNSLPQRHQAAISNITSSSEDGFLICSFYLNSTFNIHLDPPKDIDNRVNVEDIPTKDNLLEKTYNADYNLIEEDFLFKNNLLEKTFSVDYNLNEKSYYLMLAAGKIKGRNIDYHTGGRDVAKTATMLGVFNTHIKKSTTSPPATTTPSNTNTFYEDCGKSKGCYGHPSGCISSHNCDMLTTYTKDSDDKFKFELIRPASSGNTYVAVGLGNSNKMTEASVMACAKTNDKINVSMYWNTQSYDSVKLAHPQVGLSNINAKVEDGYLVCTFCRDGQTKITPPGTNKSVEYVLNNSTYYLLLAKGPTKANGDIDYHDTKTVSDNPVDLSSFSTVSSSVNWFVKFHGILMVLAWMGTVNLGMFPARYARTLFPDTKIMGKAAWFGIHQILMWLTVLLTVAGTILIIIDKKLNPIANLVLHAMFGLAAIILSLIQPCLAALRCGPDHKYRPLFNWVHRGVGVAALGLASVAIGLSVHLAELPEYTLYVVYVYVSWLAASHCGMTVMKMVEAGKEKGEGGSDGVVKAGLVVFSLVIVVLCGIVVVIVAVS